MRFFPCVVTLLTACASEPYLLPESPDSEAAGAASLPMTFRKAMPDRRGQPKWEFYYKHCASVDAPRPWISKTGYECGGPF